MLLPMTPFLSQHARDSQGDGFDGRSDGRPAGRSDLSTSSSPELSKSGKKRGRGFVSASIAEELDAQSSLGNKSFIFPENLPNNNTKYSYQ